MQIGKKQINNKTTFFVAEEGQANLGDFKYALKMIDAVSQTGVDAIEFQLAYADDFYIKSHDVHKIYKEREFSEIKLKELAEYTNNSGIELIVAPLSVKMIDVMAKNGCSAFNINASDLVTPDIIDSVVDTGLPFFLSLLFADENEIEWAIDRILKKGSPDFALLLGQHTMGSGDHGLSVEHTNLGYINTLKSQYNIPVGFIDHTSEVWMPSCAVTAGADIITKHLAISREEKGPDWHVCLEPDEMKEAVRLVRSIKKSISCKEKAIAPGENIDKLTMRRSIISAKPIKKGAIINREDICFKRPGTGIPANREKDVLGKSVSTDIEKDQIIKLEYLEN
jgi:N,N'-diacetyllegionaminate synthase